MKKISDHSIVLRKFWPGSWVVLEPKSLGPSPLLCSVIGGDWEQLLVVGVMVASVRTW